MSKKYKPVKVDEKSVTINIGSDLESYGMQDGITEQKTHWNKMFTTTSRGGQSSPRNDQKVRTAEGGTRRGY